MASFSVAVLMRETADVVMRFLAHYNRIGARRIMVYVDEPPEPASEKSLDPSCVSALGGEIIVCDSAFWATRPGGRPGDVEERQSVVYGLAQARCTEDWLFLCDADEFILDRIPVTDFLDRIPPDIPSVRILPAEAVWGPGDDRKAPFRSTWFRRPELKSRRDAFRAYGPWGEMLRSGVVGHTIGKQFIRRDARLDRIDLHFSFAGGQRVTRLAWALDSALADVELAHYDAISFERWRTKFERRTRPGGGNTLKLISGRRRLQHRLFQVCDRIGPWAVRRLFERMYCLNARQTRFLEERGLAFRMEVFESPVQAGSERSR